MIQLEFESIKDELILVSQEAHAIVEEKQPKIENEPNFVESLEEKKKLFTPSCEKMTKASSYTNETAIKAI